MCSFASAHAGLRCAVDLQRALAPQPLRVGLHCGFVMADAERLLRPQRRARREDRRLRPAGRDPGVGALREYTASDPSFAFEPRGEHYSEGLHGEHPVFAVAWS